MVGMVEMSEDIPLPKGSLSVGIIFNCKSGQKRNNADDEAEYDSMDTVHAIRDALMADGFQVRLYEADSSLAGRLLREPVDIAFNIAEGVRGRGREAEVPAVLNLLGIPFTGSDETALAVALDKDLCKRLLSTYGICSPRSAVFTCPQDADSAQLRFPIIVKPNAEGSSKGIPDACIAADAAQLHDLLTRQFGKYNEPLLAEEYIDGREFTVGILGNGASARAFAPMEIAFRHNTSGDYRVYSFDVKQDYTKHVDYLCPAPVAPACAAQMQHTALCAFRALGCHDFTRVDFRLAPDGTLYFIEMNPLPGLAPGYSDYPMLADFCGVGYRELVCSVLRAALTRLGMTEGAVQ